jgi:peptidylprolyl isomerase|tara:strand:- start:161 stop:1195 length:1035 start_codon:yes stop_codon:yes gene_type:complete
MFELKSVMSKRILVLAGMLALIVLTACQAAGKNPEVIDIPVISATVDVSLCQNEFYPQGSPIFGDVTSDQLRGDVDGIKIFDRVVGEGDSPNIEDLVTVKYTGWLDGGCVFDSTYARGEDAELLLVALIPGWRQAMLTMKPGGSRRVEIPSSLGYRELGSPPVIPGNATLTFEIELVTVLTPAQAIVAATAIAANATATPIPTATPEGGPIVSCDNPGYPESAPQYGDVSEDQYSDEPSGIRVFDLKVGDGGAVDPANTVDVHYTGWLVADGCVFDSSYTRGASVSFPVGGVIPGFRDAILGMNVGGQRRVYIPSDQGYGAQGAGGAIPPNADLVFDIVLDSVR